MGPRSSPAQHRRHSGRHGDDPCLLLAVQKIADSSRSYTPGCRDFFVNFDGADRESEAVERVELQAPQYAHRAFDDLGRELRRLPHDGSISYVALRLTLSHCKQAGEFLI